MLAFLAGGLIVGVWLEKPWSDPTPDSRFDFKSTDVPGEFLYLDPERVISYLAQIRGGVAGPETRTSQVEDSAGLSLPSGGGQFQRRSEAGVSRQVQPSNAADFLSLLDKLKDPDLQRPVRFRTLDARPDPASPEEFARAVLALKEGDFVLMRDARVLLPAQVRPYDAIRRFGPANFSTDRSVQRSIRRYAATVGADPRVVFNLGEHSANDDGGAMAGDLDPDPDVQRLRPGCPTTGWRKAFHRVWPTQDRINARVLVPVRYSLLAPEPSLLSGGDSNVVGKVIRVLRPPTTTTPGPAPRESDVCYRDEGARSAFGLSIDRVPDAVLEAPPELSRERLRTALEQYASVRAPAAVVVPVAIYR